MPNVVTEKLFDEFKLVNTAKWSFNEDNGALAEPTIDGKHVIGRVVGPFFLVDGASQNQRWYSKELWETAIANSQEKFKQGGMLGTIGHEKPIDEDCIREGAISHLVTNLWIDESGIGMGEIKILDTPAGRTLNTLMRAGYQIPVSSRAYGTYSGKTGDGYDVVDPKTFDLKNFDFVMNPGVGYAYPKIVESKQQEPIEEKQKMDFEKLMERANDNNALLQTKLTEALQSNSTLVAEKAELAKSVDEHKKVIAFYNKKVGNISETKIMEGAFRKWMEFEPWKTYAREAGLFDQHDLSMSKTTNKLLGLTESQHKEIESLKAKIVESDKAVKELTENKAEYEKFGTPKEVALLYKITESYAKIGKPQELIEKLTKASEISQKFEDAKRKAAARKISEKMGVPQQTAHDLLKKMPVKEAVAMLKSLNSKTDLKDRYTVATSVNENKGSTTKTGKEKSKVETAGGAAGRFFESMEPPKGWVNPMDEMNRARGMR